MACDANSSRIARLAGQVSGAISQLSAKQAFLAGVAVGASGTGLGAFLVAKRQRIANRRRGRQQRRKPVRQVIAKPKPQPVPGLSSGSTKPKPVPGLSSGSPGPRPIPGVKPKPIPTLTDTPQTTLRAAPIRVLDRGGQPFTVKKGYQVLRPDGSQTGLAVTPHLEEGDKGHIVEKPGAWSVTHMKTGALIDGPYPNVAQAQRLATALSSLRWNISTLPKADVDQAKKIIGQYRQSLAKEEK